MVPVMVKVETNQAAKVLAAFISPFHLNSLFLYTYKWLFGDPHDLDRPVTPKLHWRRFGDGNFSNTAFALRFSLRLAPWPALLEG